MSEWKKTRLGDLYALPSRNGLTRPSAVRGSGYKMAAMGEIFADDFIGASDMERVQLNERELNTMLLEEDDLLFARQSLILSGAGKCAIVRGLTEPTTFESHLIRVRLNKALANSLFYMYYFHSSCSPIKSIVQQGVQAGIRGSDLEGLLVDYPPLPIQDRIAGILSDYDLAIANCRKQIALLEEAAMRLYREWFKDGKGEMKRIEDICKKIGSGGTPSRRNENFWDCGNIPWVKTGELQDCWIFDTEEKITAEGLSGSSAKMFPAETLMMAIYASPTLGRLGILDMPACCNQATLCLIADETVVSWQWLYCKLYELRDKFNAIARGAGQQNISGIVVKEYSVVVPERRKVESFTTTVASMFQLMRVMGKQIRTLTEARDRLLPKLMKGEVAV